MPSGKTFDDAAGPPPNGVDGLAVARAADGPNEVVAGIPTGEFRNLVEVAEIHRTQERPQHVRGAADVHHHSVGVQFRASKFQIDDVGGAVETLGRSEDCTRKAVGDHDVVANEN